MVIQLSKLFELLQQEMFCKMSKPCNHGPSKGDISEESWKNFFKSYLPKRYSCDKAFIVDSLGNMSEQIDLVIYDEYFSPFIFNQNNFKYIPIESVYAVFEVKQRLSLKHFNYSQEKAKSVRSLLRTSAPVLCNGRLVQGKQPNHIIAGTLTTNKAWEKELIKQSCNYEDLGYLDIGCCINGKSWMAVGNNYVLSKNDEESLLTFFMKFIELLQQQGTVPAMNIQNYFNGFN